MILVTGATGRTGQRVVEALRTAGQPVRILVRAGSRVPAGWGDVERAIGDLADAVSLRRAMEGADALFLLAPMDPDLDRLESTVLDVAARVGVGHLVKMSTTKPDPASPISWWRAHWRSEQALMQQRVPWTILRPNGISFFLLQHAREIREEGALRTAAGAGRMALVDADDIAAVTVRVLAEPERYVGQILDLTGPEAVSYTDVADLLTSLTGRRVVHAELEPAEARERLVRGGHPEWEADGIVANWVMTREGRAGFDQVTDEVERVCGRPPFPLARFLAAHLPDFLPATVPSASARRFVVSDDDTRDSAARDRTWFARRRL